MLREVGLHVAGNLKYPENIIGVPGVALGVAATGEKDKDDLVIIKFEDGSRIAGVFTNSAFAAPPVILAKARQNSCRAWIINSGNANAATGEPGMKDAKEICGNTSWLVCFYAYSNEFRSLIVLIVVQ